MDGIQTLVGQGFERNGIPFGLSPIAVAIAPTVAVDWYTYT